MCECDDWSMKTDESSKPFRSQVYTKIAWSRMVRSAPGPRSEINSTVATTLVVYSDAFQS